MRVGEEVCDRDSQKQGGIVCAGNFIVDRVHTLSYWPEQGNLAHILHQDLGVGGRGGQCRHRSGLARISRKAGGGRMHRR